MRKILLAAAAAMGLMAVSPALAQMPAPADLIKRWDANGDGAVSRAEWVAAGRPAERFGMIDANKDGNITAAELKAAMARMRQQNGG